MRPSTLAALAVAFLAASAGASEPKEFTLKLGQTTLGNGVIQTDISPTEAPAASTRASSQPLVGAVPSEAGGPSPQAVAGVPLISGAGEPADSAPNAAQAAATSQVEQAAQTAPASVTGIEPGTPAPVYTSLGAAAKAGVDPLGERVAKVAPKRIEREATFNWTDPQAYLAHFKANPEHLKFGAFAALALGLLVWLVRRRSN